MKIINSQTFNAYFNIAAEEYLLDNFDSDIFYLYQNSPSIIVGRKQNTLAEINLDYVKEHNIPVVRRMSGGGAVFHDIGNLNFCFIIRNYSDMPEDSFDKTGFEKYTKPIIEVLQDLGVNAKLEGRNDLTIEGKKFSGNAKYIRNNDLLQHGTILYMSNLKDISNALNVNPAKFNDKAVKSVQARVTNVSSHLPIYMSITDFTSILIEHICLQYPDSQLYEMTDKDKIAINKLIERKYGTWEWNQGRTREYTYTNSIQTKGGNLQVSMIVKNGYIEELTFFGDFFSAQDLDAFERKFQNIPHSYDDIFTLLAKYPAEEYFYNISSNELLKIMF
ncbi:MAG: lipoate--protein ligase [Candidatus Cloacimonetes bacterium]|nr:lipoate--protein ligase [Candidatus Cloacimonadota bacterium]